MQKKRKNKKRRLAHDKGFDKVIMFAGMLLGLVIAALFKRGLQ